MSDGTAPDPARLRDLADTLRATTGDDPAAAAVILDLVDHVLFMAARVDSLWQIITAVIETSGLDVPPPPPADFLHALTQGSPQTARFTVGGQEWVAAIAPGATPDPAATWAALERLTTTTQADPTGDG